MRAAFIPMRRPTFEAALRDASSKKVDARLAAADRLSDAPDERRAEAAAALARLADDPDQSVRRTALLGLGELEGDEGAAHLDLVLLRFDDGHPAVRQAAIITAGRLGGAEAEAAIRGALASRHADMRFQAVMSLVELAPGDAVSAVSALLGDADPEVRAHAAEALGKLGDETASDVLAPLLTDDAMLVRHEAALALAGLGDDRGAAVLMDALDAPEAAIAAAMALGELRVERAREPLAKIAGRFWISPLMRAAVGGALARLDDPRGISALRAAMHALRADGRGLAVMIAGELVLDALAEDVAVLARKPRGADPVVVAETLGRLAPRSAAARAALEDMARGDDPEGAAAAKAALG